MTYAEMKQRLLARPRQRAATNVLRDCGCVADQAVIDAAFIALVGKLRLDARTVAWATTALAANDGEA